MSKALNKNNLAASFQYFFYIEYIHKPGGISVQKMGTMMRSFPSFRAQSLSLNAALE